ncbi:MULTISPECIES: hypothetical protein [Helicobacter]|uniref:hypothetical protein n=1 Tax=Helicobacter TaxID=209 RepID=UPI0013CDE9D3|nr:MULTISPECIES: hypothetical protein [Helicobacter]
MGKILACLGALLWLAGCCQCPITPTNSPKQHKSHKKPPKVAPNDGEPHQVE